MLIVIAVVAVVLLLPIGLDAEYENKVFQLRLRFLVLHPQQYRFPKQESDKPRNKSQEEPEESDGEAEQPKNREQRRVLLRLLFQALRRVKKKVKIDLVQLHICAAAADPYTAAMRYGRFSAALYSLSIFMDGFPRVKRQDLQLTADFDKEKIEIRARLILSLRVAQLLAIGIRFCADFLRWKRKKRKEEKTRITERTEDHGKQQDQRTDAGNNEQAQGNG